MATETNLEKLQRLLRQMFQFDCADLDFGIYRIMNHKRDAIERFIQKDLVEAIGKELSSGVLAGQSQVAAELQEVTGQIRETLGEDALNGDGKLAETYHHARLGKRYLALQAKAAGAQPRPALEAAIFNHLYSFFSRYYDAGDFLSKRRYSRKQKYAIPYNGEEVYLHWANSDQYYIKTGEYFTDYRFTSRGLTVHFRLQQASVERDNVKGEKRFFVSLPKETAFDAKAKEIVIPFEYRPLTEQETVKYGQRNQQETILAEAQQAVFKQLGKADAALAALMAVHHQNAEGQQVSCLEHHLRQYTQRNTSDFFIHKDLKGFLLRELDFYLKNEVLNLDDVAAGEARAEGWFQVMRVIRAIGEKIILFLAQVEDFQKRLFEKRKFITETQYCITVANIAESFHEQIAANDAQWQEWKDLFHIDEEEKHLFNASAKNRKDQRVTFLKFHPTLVLDTKHFDQDFKDRLLAIFNDLDDLTDGLLIHGENFQALNLLGDRCRERIKCIYIDPPYNTDAGPILYKNGYRSSSWITMMENRLAAARALLADDGIICVTIDDYQVHELGYLLERVFGKPNHLGVAVIRNNPSGRSTVTGFSVCHEYAFFYRRTDSATLAAFPRTEKQLKRFTKENGVSVDWRNFRKDGGAVTYRAARPRQYYPIYVNVDRRTLRIPVLTWDKGERKWLVEEKPIQSEAVLWPVDEKGKERVWSLNSFSAREHLSDLEVRIAKDGKPQVFRRHTPSEGVLPRSWWDKKTYAAREYGSAALADLFGESSAFTFAKSPFAVQDCLWVSGLDSESTDEVLDFFAGSGTTGHAVINLNREDGGQRRFLAVEVEPYFDTVLLPRIKKVTFSPEWKNGKPVRQATAEESDRSPRVVKYIRLESYEDALSNISFTLPKGQKVLEFNDYLLKYMLQWETKESEALLNVEKLASPFSYGLTITDGRQTVRKTVDIPETFAYLLGLHVRKRSAHQDKDRRYLVYRGRIDHREVAVIWRDTKDWDKKDYQRDKEFVAAQKLAEGADETFVNGDSFILGARALEPVFKSRMFGGL